MKRALREVQVQVSWDYWEAALHARRMDTGSDLRYFGAVESWGGVEGGGFVFLAASEAGRPGRAKTSSSNAAVGCGEGRAAAGGRVQAECRPRADREQQQQQQRMRARMV